MVKVTLLDNTTHKAVGYEVICESITVERKADFNRLAWSNLIIRKPIKITALDGDADQGMADEWMRWNDDEDNPWLSFTLPDWSFDVE